MLTCLSVMFFDHTGLSTRYCYVPLDFLCCDVGSRLPLTFDWPSSGTGCKSSPETENEVLRRGEEATTRDCLRCFFVRVKSFPFSVCMYVVPFRYAIPAGIRKGRPGNRSS